jgi:hypothetical protein
VRGAIPPLPNTPSGSGAKLKHMDNLLNIIRLIKSRRSRLSGVYNTRYEECTQNFDQKLSREETTCQIYA